MGPTAPFWLVQIMTSNAKLLAQMSYAVSKSPSPGTATLNELLTEPSELSVRLSVRPVCGYDLTPLVRGWLATTPQLVPVRAQIVCGPAPEPHTSLLSVYPL